MTQQEMQQAVQELIQMINTFEYELFSGSFKESIITSDMAYRPAEKRSFYIESLNKLNEGMDTALNIMDGNPTAGEYIAKAKRNKEQIQKMLNYVRSY